MEITFEQNQALQTAAGNRYDQVCRVLGIEVLPEVDPDPVEPEQPEE